MAFDPRAEGKLRLAIERVTRDEVCMSQLDERIPDFLAYLAELEDAFRARFA